MSAGSPFRIIDLFLQMVREIKIQIMNGKVHTEKEKIAQNFHQKCVIAKPKTNIIDKFGKSVVQNGILKLECSTLQIH